MSSVGKAKFLHIELVNKSIYKSDRIVCTHLLFQCSEKGLIAVISLYELHGVIYTHFTTVLVLMHISVYLNEQASFFTESRCASCSMASTLTKQSKFEYKRLTNHD